MQQAAARLLAQRAGAGPLRRALGAPDAVLAPGSADHARAREGVAWIEAAPSAAPQRTDLETGALWLYRWRGTHDQLVFALVGGRVAAAGWVYAGE